MYRKKSFIMIFNRPFRVWIGYKVFSENSKNLIQNHHLFAGSELVFVLIV